MESQLQEIPDCVLDFGDMFRETGNEEAQGVSPAIDASNILQACSDPGQSGIHGPSNSPGGIIQYEIPDQGAQSVTWLSAVSISWS